MSRLHDWGDTDGPEYGAKCKRCGARWSEYRFVERHYGYKERDYVNGGQWYKLDNTFVGRRDIPADGCDMEIIQEVLVS